MPSFVVQTLVLDGDIPARAVRCRLPRPDAVRAVGRAGRTPSVSPERCYTPLVLSLWPFSLLFLLDLRAVGWETGRRSAQSLALPPRTGFQSPQPVNTGKSPSRPEDTPARPDVC
ncbi:hypothetical protein RhiJN_07323 [Ceratobasidium sp. AG-Ba]|nr:hypothetical protein RhiJN_07323 [Ceratobasidium sp. AG-Ba]QRW06775.1 hypothetical protein RhiLY_05774 [Ceratobasidium sp. AG-Ba]